VLNVGFSNSKKTRQQPIVTEIDSPYLNNKLQFQLFVTFKHSSFIRTYICKDKFMILAVFIFVLGQLRS
jgi:hypothetical protein